MIILEDINPNKNLSYNYFVDATYFTTHIQAFSVCLFAIITDFLGILLSGFICSIIIIKHLWADPQFVFILCYFISEIVHSLAYMFSIITSCYLTVTFNEWICKLIEILLLLSGMTAGIWLCLNGLVRMIYFVYPFKYVAMCTLRNCMIIIAISILAILSFTMLMGGFTYRRPTFTNDCRKADKIELYRRIMFVYLFITMFIQLYCPYRIWRLMKEQWSAQNALFMPPTITRLMSFQKRKTFRMLLLISSGLWLFFFPVLFLEIFTKWYIEFKFPGEVSSDEIKSTILYSTWPLIETICKITQRTLRPVVASCCVLVSCPQIKRSYLDWKRRFFEIVQSPTQSENETLF